MIGDVKKAMTISKNNAGFPDYLDFNKLRTEGINYLGKLAGKIWTDHNLHDPGITILEVLCYAMLDLGYRTNLPVADILATDPQLLKPEDNFFTPAQILTNNPLTINDYRKLLIDIPGIRNAWLVPARDIKDLCRQRNTGNNDNITNNNLTHGNIVNPVPLTQCEEFLNGIYHVYIETEVDVDQDFHNDDPVIEEADKQNFIKKITGDVRKVLMAHRNLCEDFADIYILCKLETGVCATIEIEDGANVEEVYLEVANRLRDYFSPTPKFYTLDQMLNKERSMDEAFAGRPFSPKSHGFIDTDELEAIELKKEIHTSDIYHVIFDVEGVRKVSRLKFRNCGKPCLSLDGKKNSDWVFHLPKNHVPVFSLSCSGFEFTMNGLPISFDQDKYNTQLELAWLHNGKVLYKMPSPYLDAELPKGQFHPDLGEHYSIQNDFPAVYGIGEGDLPDDVSDLRKAQMMQLRGYLMFFDQLLANYLSQLQNIRQLFSFPHPTPLAQHTYFLNTITTIPEMDKLLRFGQSNGLGPAGAVLAFPVDKTTWDTTIFNSQPAAALIAGFSSYSFSSLFGVDEATGLLRNDLINDGESQVVTKQAQDLKWIYAIISSSGDFVMVGNKIFQTEEEAERHASSVQYAGVFEKNYRSFITAATQFTFDLELNLTTYTDYLGLLVEDEDLYEKRRTGFLTHLLSRFAEQFTDFVIYNWKSAMGVSDIYAAENYLSEYPDLSRNRGRAFNYQLNGLIDNNVSGFEKKVKAIAGIYSGKKNHLCHFAVEPFDETYFFDPLLQGKNFNALKAGNKAFISTHGNVNEKLGYVYRLVDKDHIPAVFSLSFNDKATALARRLSLSQLTRKLIDRIPKVNFEKDLFSEVSPGQFSFAIPVDNLQGIAGDVILFQGIKKYGSREEAIRAFNDNLIDVTTYAADKANYGQYIIFGNQAVTDKTIAQIPDDTKTSLENTFGAVWLDELVKQISIYPFRKIDITSIQYAEIFCTEYMEPAPGEENKPENVKYYFNLPLNDDIQGNWISTTHFENKEELFKEFAFFSMLVNYPGNYYVDCACTRFFDKDHIVHKFSFKLFIREVLAQSIDVFATVEEAWGPLGIEKFICAAQGEKAFWTYQRNKECFSFYVTCGAGSLMHPCSYDSEETRKRIFKELMEIGSDFISKQSYFFNPSSGELFNAEGKTFAKVDLEKIPAQDRCDLFITVAEMLSNQKGKTTYSANTGFLTHTLPQNIVIHSVEKRPELSDDAAKEWIKEWERELYNWACYFPVVRTKLKTNKGEPDKFKYCIEIKLPHFSDCSGSGREGKGLCHIAWKSSCCFSSCKLAVEQLQEAWKLLSDKKNYHLVFNCEDETYGIALHTYHPSLIGGNQNPVKSDIIAINPQCYPTMKEDCKAVERAIKLINIQGLHLIEHILLRPVKPEDCRCRRKLAACGWDCEFPHWVQDDFECEGNEVHVCFKPGTDPYSFIATIFLPAWSKRFRDENERVLFERLLYREAPAHVLLRILWLRPLDFCRLESTMFDWQKWIAGFAACNVDFSLCNFIELLFNRYYDCLPECVDCLPCKDPQPVKPGCWDEKDRILLPLEFVDQVNEIFCFEDYCRRKEQRPTVEKIGRPVEQPNVQPIEERPKPKRQPRKKPETPVNRTTNITKKKASPKRKKE